MIEVGDRVLILPINEVGEVWQVRKDSSGNEIFDVERDSAPMVDGAYNHVCRSFELMRL